MHKQPRALLGHCYNSNPWIQNAYPRAAWQFVIACTRSPEDRVSFSAPLPPPNHRHLSLATLRMGGVSEES